MKKKTKILARIAKSVAEFYPQYTNHFLCPTCLDVLSLNDLSKISEAHIVPKAAGGSEKTYLCKKCNSRFGTLQDKWLGEYVRLKSQKLTPLHTKIQKGHFEIDGLRLSGEFRVGDNEKLEFYIWQNKSHPEAIKNLLARTDSARRPGQKEITIPMPLLQHREEIDVGFLTTAYLLWFKELGYSWVLQNHLKTVRDQIQNPTSRIIENRYLAVVRERYFEQPWIGIGTVNEELSLMAGIADRVVFLPVADCENFYKTLGGDFDDTRCNNLQELRFSYRHRWGAPVWVLYRDRLVVMSDLIIEKDLDYGVLVFREGDMLPVLCRPITEEEYEQQSEQTNVEFVSARPGIKLDSVIEKPTIPTRKKSKKA